MTIVFRSSTFFIVFVISFKMTTFVMHDLSVSGEDRKMGSTMEQLINESFRKKQEIDEAADGMQMMSEAIDGIENRAVCWLRSAVESVKRRTSHMVRNPMHVLNVVAHACSLTGTGEPRKSGTMRFRKDLISGMRTCDVAVYACD